jgi:hypothetical protein
MQKHEETLSPLPTAPKHHRPRSGERVAVNRRAVITLPKTGKPHPVLLVDVSSGGACVQADIQLAVGDDILLRADIAPETRLAVKAVVLGARTRRQTLYGQYGLRFVQVDPEAALALRTFIGTKKKAG